MHIEKIKISNAHIYGHCDRSSMNLENYNGSSNIDPTRTHLNFNCSQNNRHREEQLQYIKEQTGKKPRKNAVTTFALALTLPKMYLTRTKTEGEGFLHEFFYDAYGCIRDFFNLKDSDVASAWVHMDEDTPHMHFLGTPLVRNEKGCHLYYDGCIPREKYKTYHPVIEKMMKAKGWDDIELLNGATVNGNLTVTDLKLKDAIRKEEERLAVLKEEIVRMNIESERINNEILTKTNYLSNLHNKNNELSLDNKFLKYCTKHDAKILDILIKLYEGNILPDDMTKDMEELILEDTDDKKELEKKDKEHKDDRSKEYTDKFKEPLYGTWGTVYEGNKDMEYR